MAQGQIMLNLLTNTVPYVKSSPDREGKNPAAQEYNHYSFIKLHHLVFLKKILLNYVRYLFRVARMCRHAPNHPVRLTSAECWSPTERRALLSKRREMRKVHFKLELILIFSRTCLWIHSYYIYMLIIYLC